MFGLEWASVVAFLSSVVFGVVSAVLPIANAEAYVAANRLSPGWSVSVAVATAIGQSIGKLLLFFGVRRGKNLRYFQRHKPRAQRDYGRLRTSARAVLARLLALVDTKRWGFPIVFLAATVGVPPIYAVALLAGATTMRAGPFYCLVLIGRIIRFVVLALGVGGVLQFWH